MPKTIPSLPGIGPSSLPFSPVVEANGFVFLAGQVGDTPERRGQRVDGDIRAEVRAMLANVERLLEATGLTTRDVVKCTVYMTDMGEFATMNEVYREVFSSDMPTRATVGVARLAADFRCEIEVLAVR